MRSFIANARTDSVEQKLRLFEAAYRAGDRKLAMSLLDSAKDTLAFEESSQTHAAAVASPADHFTPVKNLPSTWAQWAGGWTYCKALDLFEIVGIDRQAEPADFWIAAPHAHTTDLGRELRVAAVDAKSGRLVEVPCQVDQLSRVGDDVHVQVTILANVPAHRHASYLVFYGNPLAERTCYQTGLATRGEGYALTIENEHFVAQLSSQVGQLERLTSKRQHGLELYAGGKGHGEPPGIDWAHDYVDEGGFQKLRMRNWPRCLNYETLRGPLCTSIRRWGIPYSPVHPLFTPARVHMEQGYRFFAGQPYFIKEGTIRVIQDVTVEAMRDDEWVFSGYSFTDLLWIDAYGKLHEGEVPADKQEELWGVGFFHRVSRDAFVALRLEHSASGFDGLTHGGAPTLQYAGHGQLWSRYPVNHAQLKAGTVFRQKNAYYFAEYEDKAGRARMEQLRHRLMNPLEIRAAEIPRLAGTASSTSARLARFGETADSARLKPAIWKALRQVRDEQLYSIDANVVDMGYVYDVREEHGTAYVLVSMPHRGRPMYQFLVTAGGGRIEPGIRERLLEIDGIRDVVVEMTWEPPWSVARLSDAGRKAMGFDSK
ncbi:MAG TPA: metal-sulfur cluster assembly factor [Pirellulales bacterium]|jgi:metal-sulfur cluster biosynthetic enzyme|nr:metal-sulfur cluster assembly factor [Pirellulales bacterium]